MGLDFTENFNDFTIFIFYIRTKCDNMYLGTTDRSTDVKHITSLRQVVYVQRIRCGEGSP
jgi:hypothetical protein